MRFTSAIRAFFVEQPSLDFAKAEPGRAAPLPSPEPASPPRQEASLLDDEAGDDEKDLPSGTAPELENECRQLLLNLGLASATDLVKVSWNPRCAARLAMPSIRAGASS